MGLFGKMMTENRISSSNHVGNSMSSQNKGFVFLFVLHINNSNFDFFFINLVHYYRDVDKSIDDIGWKSKLKIPPKDRRIKTSVSFHVYPHYFILDFLLTYLIAFTQPNYV